MNDIYSFYQLISKYQIEIPIIQRDYAQGRKDTKATDVRKSIVHNMVCAVRDGKDLFFDFVYGRVDGNKFIPFDGQQRLTTLFLFHKYVFEKCQSESDCNRKDNCICKDILYRFTYSTRQSSREFCNDIVYHRIIPGEGFVDSKKKEYRGNCKCNNDEEKNKKVQEYIENKTDWITSYILNQSWFYPDWVKDPTIMGMLAMLDEIHNQMKKETNYQRFAERLTSGCSCPITFHFVDMGEHKLADDTYVKMNARGKTLTPFENFKASLEQYLEENQKTDLLKRLSDSIDGKWLDTFWIQVNNDKEEKEIPDSMMMSFVNRHFMNVWRCWYSQIINKQSEEEENQQKEFDGINKRIIAEMPLYPTKDNYVPWDIYQNVLKECGIDNCLTPIFNIWDALSKQNNNIEEECQSVWNRCDSTERWNLYQGNKNNDNRETYPSRVAFYALLKYYESNSDDLNEERLLSQWMRVIWNIVENSTIDSSEPYQAALRLIDELSKHAHDIYSFLSNPQSQIKSDFAKEQVLEEIAKAKQILNNDYEYCHCEGYSRTWEDTIIEAENYAFFKGAIRFLFTDGEGEVKWCDFDTKWMNAQRFFDKKGVKEEYRKNAVMLRSFIANFNKWEEFWGMNYDNEPLTWKVLLTSRRKTTHEILLNGVCSEEELNSFNASLAVFDNGYEELQNAVHQELVNSSILVEASKWHSKLNWRYNAYSLYPYNTKAEWKIYVIGNHRNSILSALSDKKTLMIVDRNRRFKSGECDNFFWGWNITFRYNNYNFQWDADGNIYLKDNDGGMTPAFDSSKIDNVCVFEEKLKTCLMSSAQGQ
jgi:hypothetical protein